MEKKNLHKDHRQRVRSRYLKEGAGAMADHNIVELLLFFGIPYKDTNDIAHELIERFGDLNGVLEAPFEELVKVRGVGENAATLITLVHDISGIYNERRILSVNEDNEQNDYKNFISLKYAGETKEMVYLVCLDSQGKIQRCVKICDGTPDSVTIDNRVIMETVIRFDSKNVVIAHNHANGFAVPSVADVTATRNIIPLLSGIGVNLVDHVIVSPDDVFSMATNHKYADLFG